MFPVSTFLGPNSVTIWTESEPNEGSYEIDIQLNYCKIAIQYSPSDWFMYKWAWIQYFSVFIIFYWLIKQTRSFIFENNLVETIRSEGYSK